MSEPDEELRKLFHEGREADRSRAPSFGATWGAAADRTGSRNYLWFGVAAAAAALIIGVLVWPEATNIEPVQPPQLAETKPMPDVPVEDEDPVTLAEANWGADDAFGVPTDFLLESDGALAGGIPSTDLDDPVFDLEGGFETEL